MRVGQVLKSKGGNSYLKFEKNVTISEGEALFLSTPQEDIDYLVSSGKLTADEGEARKAKVPDFVRFNIKKANNNNTGI